MAERHQVYKCEICGNIVEMLHAGSGRMMCCGQPMKVYEENTVDAAREKHVPVIEKTDTGVVVKVGSVPHPMEEAHYIEWVEVIRDNGNRVGRVYLKPGDKPEAAFCGDVEGTVVREFCNLHGLWKAE